MRHVKKSHQLIIFVVCLIAGVLCYGAIAAGEALPPDPENAALLYYQAFHYLPDIHDLPRTMALWDYDNAEPDNQLNEYLEEGSEAIRLVDDASKLSNCMWGVQYSRGCFYNIDMQYLTLLLHADMYVSVADQDYQAALKRCLIARRYSEHLGSMNTDFGYSISITTDLTALGCLQYILGVLPPDEDMLTSLQGQLLLGGSPKSPASTMRTMFEMTLQAMLNDERTMDEIRRQFQESERDDNELGCIQLPTDEELLAYARQIASEFVNSALRIIGSNHPLEKSHAEIQALIANMRKKAGNDYAVNTLVGALDFTINSLFSLAIDHVAHLNATKTAIEVYLLVAQNGQLPEVLPHNLYKDPFSGEDFEYEITEEGFILRARAKNLFSCPLRPEQGPIGPDSFECIIPEYKFRIMAPILQ